MPCSHETSQLDRARAQVRARLEAARASASNTTREIVAAHLELLDDPELLTAARSSIASGKSAGYAWRQAILMGPSGPGSTPAEMS